MQEVIPAQIIVDNGTPYAPAFGDCYYTRQDGLAESRYVFLAGNDLPQRWQGQAHFTVGELGFGTGLNFLATWQAWQADPQRCSHLHYVAVEKHPIPRETLQTLLVSWPELVPYATELLVNYPSLLYGFHRLILANGAITLTLCLMDVQEALAELVATVDAWYLDGFAPDRNPEMWELPVLHQVATHSRAGATVATFSAATRVREALQAAGFVVAKRKGFGKKREMLTASLLQPPAMPSAALPPWFALPAPVTEGQVTVVGGGIAGCQVAHALARRGWQVTLLERHSQLAREASGNRAGVLTPKLTAEQGWGELFYRQAFGYASRQLRALQAAGQAVEWAACGALQLAHEAREAARQQALLQRSLPADFVQVVDAAQASELAGIPLSLGAAYFPQAGWVHPASLCHALVRHPNIEVRTGTALLALPADTWVVLAGGRAVGQFTPAAAVPFMPVLGQTSQAQATPASGRLRMVLGHEGYITPAIAGAHIFGATFVRHVHEASLDVAADHTNYQQLARYLPELAGSLGEIRSSHAAIRMTTPDRYPVVGRLPEMAWSKVQYADVRHGRKQQIFPPMQYQANVAMAAGFGSRGLVTSGLAAELLAAILHGEPLPLQASLYASLHPARFLLRELQRA